MKTGVKTQINVKPVVLTLSTNVLWRLSVVMAFLVVLRLFLYSMGSQFDGQILGS